MAEKSKRSVLKFPALFVSGRVAHPVPKEHASHVETAKARLRALSCPKITPTRQVHMRHGKDLEDCLSVRNLIRITPLNDALRISPKYMQEKSAGDCELSRENTITTESTWPSCWGGESSRDRMNHKIVVNGCKVQLIESLNDDGTISSARKESVPKTRLDPLPFCHKLFPRPKRPDSAKTTCICGQHCHKTEINLPWICQGTPPKQDLTREWTQRVLPDKAHYGPKQKKKPQKLKPINQRNSVFTEGGVEITTLSSTSIVTVYMPSPNPCCSDEDQE